MLERRGLGGWAVGARRRKNEPIGVGRHGVRCSQEHDRTGLAGRWGKAFVFLTDLLGMGHR